MALRAGLDHGAGIRPEVAPGALPPATAHVQPSIAHAGFGRLLRGLGRLATRMALRDAGLCPVEPALLPSIRCASASSPGLFLPDRREAWSLSRRAVSPRLLAQARILPVRASRPRS